MTVSGLGTMGAGYGLVESKEDHAALKVLALFSVLLYATTKASVPFTIPPEGQQHRDPNTPDNRLANGFRNCLKIMNPVLFGTLTALSGFTGYLSATAPQDVAAHCPDTALDPALTQTWLTPVSLILSAPLFKDAAKDLATLIPAHYAGHARYNYATQTPSKQMAYVGGTAYVASVGVFLSHAPNLLSPAAITLLDIMGIRGLVASIKADTQIDDPVQPFQNGQAYRVDDEAGSREPLTPHPQVSV